jgi:hypothetical protein
MYNLYLTINILCDNKRAKVNLNKRAKANLNKRAKANLNKRAKAVTDREMSHLLVECEETPLFLSNLE